MSTLAPPTQAQMMVEKQENMVKDLMLGGKDANNPGGDMGISEGMPVVTKPKRRRESLDVNLLTPQMNKLTLMVGDEKKSNFSDVNAIAEENEDGRKGDPGVMNSGDLDSSSEASPPPKDQKWMISNETLEKAT